jgi:DNA polymerase-3 subunit delta'
VNELTSSYEVESRSEPTADQIRPVRILTAFLQKKTIPHALLFTGIDGVGKNRIATIFAMTANCAEKTGPGSPAALPAGEPGLDPCGSCRSCRKIEKGFHPDILRVQPDGRTIRIHQIRTLIETLSLKPMEASWRFVIIEQADTMRPAAANALLKTLEEPPDRTVLILMAGQAADLLPTIVSRCRHVRFHPFSARSIADRLVSDHGVSAAEATLAAAASGGSLTRAVAIGNPDWALWRNWLITACGLESPQDLSQKPMGELLAFAEQLSKNKSRVPEALEIMTGWLRDLIVVRHNKKHVTNTDRIDALQELARQLPVGTLMTKIDIIRTARHRIEANSNLRLTLEAMVLRLLQDCVKE